MSHSELNTLPDGVAEANELLGRLDLCLRQGLSRLADEREDLSAFAAAFVGTPLEEPIGAAVEAVFRSEFLPAHLRALAAGRVAVQGAMHDALLAQLDALTERTRESLSVPVAEPPAESASALASLSQWLVELAITGFAHLGEESVEPFVPTLEQLQADPKLTSVAALATGFVGELLRHLPTERQPELPTYRWADIWAGLLIRTQQVASRTVGERVSGVCRLIGVDVQSHENFAHAVVYALFDDGDSIRTVRIPFVSYKVGALSGPGLWDLFGKTGDAVLKALETHRELKVSDAELLPTGDLLLRSPPKSGSGCDPFEHADAITALPSVPPLLRHPVHIAELMCIDGPLSLPIDDARLLPETEWTPDSIAKRDAVIGLLRFDAGEWKLQPLACRAGDKVSLAGERLVALRAKQKSNTLAILTERAGKLLRGK